VEDNDNYGPSTGRVRANADTECFPPEARTFPFTDLTRLEMYQHSEGPRKGNYRDRETMACAGHARQFRSPERPKAQKLTLRKLGCSSGDHTPLPEAARDGEVEEYASMTGGGGTTCCRAASRPTHELAILIAHVVAARVRIEVGIRRGLWVGDGDGEKYVEEDMDEVVDLVDAWEEVRSLTWARRWAGSATINAAQGRSSSWWRGAPWGGCTVMVSLAVRRYCSPDATHYRPLRKH
jgi:hypothetical protein